MSRYENQLDAPRLIQGLLRPEAYDHSVVELRLIETHISWVILTGPFAYKLKKPVALGFVDFSNLEARHFYCREELRLNRRLALDLYKDVVPITGSVHDPKVGGDGEAIEYAVKLRQFPQQMLLSQATARGDLLSAHIDDLAKEVANFHSHADIARDDSPFGTADKVIQPIRVNFEHLSHADLDLDRLQSVDDLASWSEERFIALRDTLDARKTQGFVRECHGDMHLNNMILDHGRVTIFDCIEFNEGLRWIDVMSEVAFCAMDLRSRGKSDFAHRFINAYLQHTGDYEGLALLRFYAVYRALVRAKVASIRLGQQAADARPDQSDLDELHHYLDLAKWYTQPQSPCLMIAHGVSGSGKTYGTQPIIESIGGIRIRSDVERKRLFGLDETSRSRSPIDAGLYAESATRRTYDRLATLADHILKLGYPVIVDATFLHREQRQTFHDIADRLGVPFHILSFHASERTLRDRITKRLSAGEDASEATVDVLRVQLDTQEPIDVAEQPFVIDVDTDAPQATKLQRWIEDISRDGLDG